MSPHCPSFRLFILEKHFDQPMLVGILSTLYTVPLAETGREAGSGRGESAGQNKPRLQ